ncbi:MAG: CDP-glucose 4,6-dehydratase [Thermoanaerobaculia bacterium]
MQPFDWKGKRVFVTGHTGFKGSWLCLWLQLLGAQVHGYARLPPTRPNLFDLADVAAGIESTIGDVCDVPALEKAIAEAEPEIVFHLAAQPIVGIGYEDPVGTIATNVMGTAHVLDAARRHPGIRSVVIVTSDKCYTNHEWIWSYREKSQLGGRDPYAASKSCAELLVHSFRESYFGAEATHRSPALVASVRAGNVIGGGDWAPGRLVPDILTSLREERPLVLRHPEAIRPWQHVLEPLRGYLQVAERLYSGDEKAATAWNFGPVEEDCVPVSWLAGQLAKQWGHDVHWEPDPVPRPHEDTFLKLDCSKARAVLAWAPILRLTDGLDWIVDWYRALDGGADVRRTTIDQIARYRELARDRSDATLNAAVGVSSV